MTTLSTSKRRKAPRGSAAPSPGLGPVEQIAINLLRPYSGNARTHDKRQLFKIGQSLESFGWMNPILAQADGTIIAGHGRWLAAKELGHTHCPVIRFEHLTEDQIRAYRLADNRLAELSGWDDDILRIELQHLTSVELDFNIEAIGWENAQIDFILDPEAKKDDDPADADGLQVDDTAIARLGDLWLLGEHRVLCGSATEAESFETLMGGKKAAMFFVDAPYNVKIQGHVSGLGKVKHREFVEGSGEKTDAEFQEFLGSNARLLASSSIDGAIIMMCMDWRGSLNLQLAIRDAGLSLINLAVWVKQSGSMGSLYRSQHELVFITKSGTGKHINNVQLGKHGRYRTNAWSYAGVNTFGRGRMEQLEGHPTVKPIAMVADAIRDVSNRGQIVLDSFLGSGTTLLAAERTGRIGYGMDLDPVYVDLAIRRWEKLTRGKAVLAATGQTFAEVSAERLPT